MHPTVDASLYSTVSVMARICMHSLHTWHELLGQAGAAYLKALTILLLAMTFLAMTATLM